MPELALASFAGRVGEAFRVTTPEVELTLSEVESLADAPAPGSSRAPFSIVFTGPVGSDLPQQIYRLEHEALGSLDVFLVPIGPARYQAVFA
jgi:hypothetical protein